DHDDEDLAAVHQQSEDAVAPLHELRELWKALHTGAEETADRVLQEKRNTDRRDQGDEARGASQLPVGDLLGGHGDGRRHDHSGHDDDQHRHEEVRLQHPVVRHAVGHEHGAEHPDHEDLAVGEVDEPQDAVDHRVAQGHQSVHRTLDHTAGHHVAPAVGGDQPALDLEADRSDHRPHGEEQEEDLQRVYEYVDDDGREICPDTPLLDSDGFGSQLKLHSRL